MPLPRKEIKARLTRYVASGGIVLASKVRNGCKHNLSFGPHTPAVKDCYRYSIISYGKLPDSRFEHKFTSLWESVNWFVDFCGNDVAYQSLVNSRSH